MRIEAKKNLLAASLYVALAVMIVTIVSVTVLSVARKAQDKLPQESEEATSNSTKDTLPSPPTEIPNASEDPDQGVNASPMEPVPDTQVDTPVNDSIPDRFTVPCNGYISKGYEPDLPVWSTTMEDYRIHDGIDVLCDSDAEVFVCADGTVESIYEDPLMGYAITVYHGGGLRSTYMGLTGDYPRSVSAGAKVNAGQVLGWVGDSALIECSEPKHLHFVMTLNEKTVNPLDYIEFESATMSEYE